MSIPGGINLALLAPSAAAVDTGARSLRFNSADSAYLSRTPASAGNRRTYTFACWVKKSKNAAGDELALLGGLSTANPNPRTCFYYEPSTDVLVFDSYSTSFDIQLKTSAVFRDNSAWAHVVLALDTTQAIASDRVKIYVNGVQITAFGTATYPSQNFETHINAAAGQVIGAFRSTTGYFDGYLADVHFIDGQALDPTSFGEFDTNGVWQPIAYSGSYGTNGFHLTFSNNSDTTSTTLGKDAAGSNNWTPNNFSVAAGSGNDSLVDVPQNGDQVDTGVGGEVRGNYCTANPLDQVGITLANGNLDISNTSAAWANIRGTLGVSTGKWYWEVTCSSVSNSSNYATIGIAGDGAFPAGSAFHDLSTAYAYYSFNGQKFNSGAGSAYGNTYTTGDVIGVALDLDAGTLKFYKNGTVQNSGTAAFTGLSGTFRPAIGLYGSSCSVVINAGARPFAYTAPSGFKALCTTNLPTPTIADGSTAMNIQLWTGNSTNGRAITGYGFSPDFVWIKRRNASYANNLFDTVRGIAAGGWAGLLYSDNTAAEDTGNTNTISSFDSDGFTLGIDGGVNYSGSTYVGWAWDAGSSTVSNTDGSITSSVRANASAGFSIVTYSGTLTTTPGTAPTVGHGLNAAPQLIISKSRNPNGDDSGNWYVNHSYNYDNWLRLNLTDPGQSIASSGGGTTADPTSSVFSTYFIVGSNCNNNNYIAYCWAPVEGYSAFGSYVGNFSTDGPFVYTGFRPRFVMMKASSAGGNWSIIDSTRSNYNLADDKLWPSQDYEENSATLGGAGADNIDILSNGFKLKNANNGTNGSGVTYIYAAFAENPFQTARAR